MRSIVVGGVTSGVGKTTIACALMAAYRRRGHRVQPYKAGPDYIDPSHHTAAAGRPARNIDSVLVPEPGLRTLYSRATRSMDIAIVEGVMGLFDGRNGRGEEGSTAHIAKLIGAPVVVVIDVGKTSRTAGAIALGMAHFDPSLKVAGFILNRVASPSHAEGAREAVETATGLPVLGTFPRNAALAVPERYLGLIPTEESRPDESFYNRLADVAATHIDLDRIWALSHDARDVDSGAPRADGLFPSEPVGSRTAIAVARDAAFNFYYEDNLDLLRAWGAELIPFSPLEDDHLPANARGIYVGGGFPEIFAEQLEGNAPMRSALHAAAGAGIPIYGECGGFMYLGKSLVDLDGQRRQMGGIVPVDSVMQDRRVSLGYREGTALQSSPILCAGDRAIGHVFHYSTLATPLAEEHAAYQLNDKPGSLDGYACGNVLASYLHVHFGSDARIAPRFIAACVEPARRG